MDKAAVARCAGWAFHMCSITLLTWENGPQFFPFAQLYSNAEVLSLVMLASYAVSFLVLSFLAFRGRRFKNDRALIILALVLSVAGTLAVVATGGELPVCRILGFAFLGAGNAAVFVVYQRYFSSDTTYRAGLQIAIASCIGTLLLIGLSLVPLSRYLMVISFIANAISIAFAMACSHAMPSLETARTMPPVTISTQDVHGFRFLFSRLWRPVLCVASLGFVWELVTSFVLADFLMQEYAQFLVPIANLVGVALLIPLWIRFHDKIDLVNMYQLLFPIVATGFLLVPFLGFEYRLLFASGTCLIFGVVSMLMQVTCVQEFKHTGIDPLVISGCFAGCVYAFTAFGYFVGHLFLSVEQIGFSQLLVIALVFVYALSLVLAAVHFRKTRPDAFKNEVTDNKRNEEIADRYGLTERESEVFALIVKGRDLPFISDELCISKNTVKSHSKSIYRKMGIHSKQDLLDIIEQQTKPSQSMPKNPLA